MSLWNVIPDPSKSRGKILNSHHILLHRDVTTLKPEIKILLRENININNAVRMICDMYKLLNIF